MECSDFFSTHEVIGSSLLFVHDRNQASVWLIDFAKTVVLPIDIKIDHGSIWSVGNHEDGYLIGINNLIDIFEELQLREVNAVPDHETNKMLSNPESDQVSISQSECNNVANENLIQQSNPSESKPEVNQEPCVVENIESVATTITTTTTTTIVPNTNNDEQLNNNSEKMCNISIES